MSSASGRAAQHAVGDAEQEGAPFLEGGRILIEVRPGHFRQWHRW